MVKSLEISLKLNWHQNIHTAIKKISTVRQSFKLNQKFSPIFDELSCKSWRIQTIEIKILQIAF